MTAPITVAAVIINYRHGEFLAGAVASVLAQTRPVDEIVVVDDHSPAEEDHHLAALPSGVSVIQLPQNMGPGAARQIGADRVSSDWIAWLDADDIWVPTKVARQLEHLAQYPDAIGSHTGAVTFDSSGTERVFDTRPPMLTLRQQLRRNQVAPPTCMIRRDALTAVGGWSSSREIVQDWDLFIRVAAAGMQVVGLAEPLTRVRRTGHQHLSSRGRPQIVRLLRTAHIHRELIVKELGGAAYREICGQIITGHSYSGRRRNRLALRVAGALVRMGFPVGRMTAMLAH